ncbi:DUF4407 domain-containing protein [Flavobacterium sp.]|jgi:hypothetical protein|uniref:DUF4407 domain-containing protein n=1 Tax=Flavobacterium sp. TaxID=239 RepID=UPI0037BF781D
METNYNIMDTDTYMAQNNTPHWVTRFLWWCAGADAYFLAKSPKQDRVKYAGIGGVVLATGLLAAVSGGFAFYTIFKTKGDANDDASMSFLLFIGVLLFAAIWGTIIFNLDRFIVSSTGKGDGTDSITWKEFGQALPRIIIAIILGFAISAPLEIKILDSEINSELSKYQEKYTTELNTNTDKLFKQKQAALEKDKAEYETKLNTYEVQLKVFDGEIDKLVAVQQAEMQDKRAYGFGPVAKKMQADIDNKRLEKDKFIKLKAAEVGSWRKQLDFSNEKINELSDELRESYKDNEKTAHGYDGLLKRIQISHEIGGIIPWVILAVFLCIEMGPIFFKMMMTKGPYDYMVENFNHKLQTESGVFKEDKLYEGRNGLIHMETYRYADAEIAKHEVEEKLKSQKELNTLAVTKAKEKLIKDINDNPDNFIK